ncbi:hypothetical protein THRCLA_21577 [Thraustotheca clavata]|uniref:PH domain-containing protein n=1 Tax=Thraustotheca clavata TaxID=74557 RepID=A0A1V9ZV88_9STRA|nr:hypothetical protein THRCLA_21577 [Thraustotheca clavata]
MRPSTPTLPTLAWTTKSSVSERHETILVTEFSFLHASFMPPFPLATKEMEVHTNVVRTLSFERAKMRESVQKLVWEIQGKCQDEDDLRGTRKDRYEIHDSTWYGNDHYEYMKYDENGKSYRENMKGFEESSGENAQLKYYQENTELKSYGDNAQFNSYGENAQLKSYGENLGLKSYGENVGLKSYGENSELRFYGDNAELKSHGENAGLKSYDENAELNSYDEHAELRFYGENSRLTNYGESYGLKSCGDIGLKSYTERRSMSYCEGRSMSYGGDEEKMIYFCEEEKRKYGDEERVKMSSQSAVQNCGEEELRQYNGGAELKYDDGGEILKHYVEENIQGNEKYVQDDKDLQLTSSVRSLVLNLRRDCERHSLQPINMDGQLYQNNRRRGYSNPLEYRPSPRQNSIQSPRTRDIIAPQVTKTEFLPRLVSNVTKSLKRLSLMKNTRGSDLIESDTDAIDGARWKIVELAFRFGGPHRYYLVQAVNMFYPLQKFGRKGYPHPTRLLCHQYGTLQWQHKRGGYSVPVDLALVETILDGRITPVFQKHKKSTKRNEVCSLSIVFDDRTLDLETTSEDHRDWLSSALRTLVSYAKKQRRAEAVVVMEEEIKHRAPVIA